MLKMFKKIQTAFGQNEIISNYKIKLFLSFFYQPNSFVKKSITKRLFKYAIPICTSYQFITIWDVVILFIVPAKRRCLRVLPNLLEVFIAEEGPSS